MLSLALLLALSSPQDRLDLPNRLDTWYAVTRDGKTLGMMHESVERAWNMPWRYAYRFRFEVETAAAREDFAADALLDDTFLPGFLEATAWRNEAPTPYVIVPAAEGRKLETRAAGGEPRLTDLRPEDEDRALPSLVLYALRQDGRLARPGTHRAHLLPDSVIEFEVGPAERREYLGKTVPATRVDFLKPPPASTKDLEWRTAWTDKYGRLLEVRLRGGARIQIVDGKAALADLGWFSRNGRRDPMARPEAPRPRPDGVPVPAVTADTFDSLLRELAKRPAELKRLKDEGLLEEGEKAYQGILALAKALRRKASPEQAAVVVRVVDEVESIWGGAARARDGAHAVLLRAYGRLERLEIPELERDLAELRAIAAKPELEERAERIDVLRWMMEAGALLTRGRTRQELASARLFVSGTTLSDRVETRSLDMSIQVYGHQAGEVVVVPFVQNEVYAVVNGELLRPGDIVPGSSIKLERIRRNSVLFSLRDELRDVPLRGR